VVGVLAEVVRRVHQDPVGPYAGSQGLVRQAGHGRHDVGHHVVVRHPVRVRPRRQTACMAAHQGSTVLGGHDRQPRVGALPGVVEQVGARLAGGPPHAGPPGVHADGQRRVPAAHCCHEGHHPAYLLVLGHLLTGPGPHPAEVDQRGTLRYRPVHRGHPGVVVEVGALVEERVRGAVHHRHHDLVVRAEVQAPDAQRHGASVARSPVCLSCCFSSSSR
jgi:hypothetical protein